MSHRVARSLAVNSWLHSNQAAYFFQCRSTRYRNVEEENLSVITAEDRRLCDGGNTSVPRRCREASGRRDVMAGTRGYGSTKLRAQMSNNVPQLPVEQSLSSSSIIHISSFKLCSCLSASLHCILALHTCTPTSLGVISELQSAGKTELTCRWSPT